MWHVVEWLQIMNWMEGKKVQKQQETSGRIWNL